MAFLSRRTTVMTTASTSSSHGHPTSNVSKSHGQTFSDNSLRLQPHSGSIMKRVSTMFTPKKKSAHDPLLGVGYQAPRSKRMTSIRNSRTSSDSDLEDLEEIRQPNDLGPPAPSLYSSVPEEEPDTRLSTPKRRRRLSVQSIQSVLSASSLENSNSLPQTSKRRSISLGASSLYSTTKSSSHSRDYSNSISQSLLEEEAELIDDPVFTATKVTKTSAVWAGPTRTASAPNLASFTLGVRRKPAPRLGLRELPVQVLARLFEYLPRRLVLDLAPLSRAFCRASQIVIYGTLDLRDVSHARQDNLNALLATREDLTEITRVLVCDDCPNSTFLPTFPSPIVLAHMSHLTTLTLPFFSIELLQHHTAFNLRSITFLNDSLPSTDKLDLLNWLDGQVNITALNFPRLFDPSRAEYDDAEDDPPRSPFLVTPSPTLLDYTSVSEPSPTLAPPSPFAIPLPSSPNPLTPMSPSFSSQVNSLGSSSTLLPNLKTVCAPPSLLRLLAPYRVQTLRTVGVNINDTLIGGLRPTELVGFLKSSESSAFDPTMGGQEDENERDVLETLQLNFGKSVDRRTIEKVLGAAGATLGGFPPSPTELETGRGRGREEKDVGTRESEEHPGLQNLEIAIPWDAPRADEVLYKAIHSVLPRYRALCTLVMRLSNPLPVEEKQVPKVITYPRLSTSLPAVQVNGQDNVDDALSEQARSDEGETLLSPTDTYENSVESEGVERPLAGSSQLSLASGGTVPSSIVSLTMFPQPPSSLPSEPAAPQTFEPTIVKGSSPPLRETSEPSVKVKPKTLLKRLPSLKKRGRRTNIEPFPSVPSIKVDLGPVVERSATLPTPKSHLTPRAPIVRDDSDDESSPTSVSIPSSAIPVTPTTPRVPSTPSTPRYSQFVQAQARDTRISSITSAFSVSSSMLGVDWNHSSGGGDASSEPSTPVPETPTMILTESEKQHVRTWIRQCPTLRRVVFVSGAEWGL